MSPNLGRTEHSIRTSIQNPELVSGTILFVINEAVHPEIVDLNGNCGCAADSGDVLAFGIAETRYTISGT